MFQILTKGGYFLRDGLVVVYPFELKIMAKKKKEETNGLSRTAYYSSSSERRVTEKWAKAHPSQVWSITFYGPVDVQFLRRGQTLPATYSAALGAYGHQLKQAGVADIPLQDYYYSRNSHRRLTHAYSLRNPLRVERYVLPVSYGEPKDRREALDMDMRFNREVEDMLMKQALAQFKLSVMTDLNKAGYRSGSMQTKRVESGVERMLRQLKPAPEKPAGGFEELLKHAKKKQVDVGVERLFERTSTKPAGKKTKTTITGSDTSMDTFVPRGATLMGSMD